MDAKGRKKSVALAALGLVLVVIALIATPSWAPFFAAVALGLFAASANGLHGALSRSTNTGLKVFAYLGGTAAIVGMVFFAGRAEVTSGQLTLALHTLLNGLQFGIFLFLVSAGLTLVLGIMNFVNLAHGSLFMFGAYFAAYVYGEIFESFYVALLVALPTMLLLGIALERTVVRWLYERDHLAQVLATFGIILFSNQFVVKIFGTDSLPLQRPELLSGNTPLFGAPYPLYRLAIIGSGLAIALAIYLLVSRTKAGMLVRAGASNRTMAGALGVNIPLLFMAVFGLGAILAGFAGVMSGPAEDVFPGMGEAKLILAIVVIVIGGIGSIRGAFIAAIIVGLVEASGRTFMTDVVRAVTGWVASGEASVIDEFAQTAGPAISSMIIYILMAGILFFRPEGLFPAKSG